MKTQTLNYNGQSLFLSQDYYAAPYGRVALMTTDDEGIRYNTLTKNLINEVIGENEAFLDINNAPHADKALRDAGVIGDTPIRFAQSGFVQYPLYKLNMERIRELISY